MTVTLVGGLDRLAPHYAELADEHDDLTIRVFSRYKPGLGTRIASADKWCSARTSCPTRQHVERWSCARSGGIPNGRKSF